jgi:hypothetical protein
MSIDNCVLCQYPLNQGFLKNFINKIETLPCNHQFHRLCVIAYSDSIKLRNANENSLSCALCRTVTEIPIPSPEDVVEGWVKLASKIMTAFGAGTGIAAGVCLTYSNRTSFILELFQSFNEGLFFGTRQIALVPCTTGFAGLIVSKEIVNSSFVQSELKKKMVLIYQQMCDVSITPRDLRANEWDHQITADNNVPGSSADWALNTLVFTYLTFGIDLINDPSLFDAPSERQALAPIQSFFNECITNKDGITLAFIQYLQQNRGDLLAQLRNASMNFFKERGNEALKEEVTPVFYEFMRQAYGPQLILPNLQPVLIFSGDNSDYAGYHLLIVLTLKDQLDTRIPALDQLVQSFIEDCRDPNSFFVSQVRNFMLTTHAWINSPLMPRLENPLDIFSLTDPDLKRAVWNQICESFSSRFEERGLNIDFSDE